VTPATRPRGRGAARLLHIDPCRGRFDDRQSAALPRLLRAGDLLVVNDAATLPASFRAGGVEVRLAGPLDERRWRAVLFGAGDWRTPTERRPAPPPVPVGARLDLGGGLEADVEEVSPLSRRLVTLRFALGGDALAAALYARGRPVQYSYLEEELALWDVQTAYAARPWAVEPPSAGLSLAVETLLALRRLGVELATVTHAAGLSSTGDPALDGELPLPERYDVPPETVAAIERARARGGRVVAVGTTVVRALEGAAEAGRLVAGAGVTALKIRAGFRPAIVDGVLTGIHEPGSSHLALLGAFAAPALLEGAVAHAERAGYRGHELGDSALVLCG
jgi:S-adenosylmethionine:tRNA ribosyltransferase-isomerase